MWKDLSLKDKAELIKLAINNGITDLGIIRDTYNKYAEGGELEGEVILPEVVVTPRTSALAASREATRPNTDFSYAQDMTPTQRWGANNLANSFGRLIGINPHTCLNTVTGFYNPMSTVAANINFVAHPEDYGFKEEPQSEAQPGDLIILSNKNNHPTHAVMFDSVAGQDGVHNEFPYQAGDTLVNYSNGGRNNGDYRLQGPLTRFNDSSHSGGDFSGIRRYYKYVGKKNKK